MMKIIYTLSILACLFASGLVSPAGGEEPDKREKLVLIEAGRVITISGEECPEGRILLADDKVKKVGKDINGRKASRVIDARKEVVMPGMILARTSWQASSRGRSGVHADRSIETEIYLEQIDFKPLLEAGFTAACYRPGGRGIPGVAIIYHTAGPNERKKLTSSYIPITMTSPGGDKGMLRGAVAKARAEIKKVEKARKEWEEKQKKAKEGKKPDAKDDKDKPSPDKDKTAEDKEKKEQEKKEGDKQQPEKKDEKPVQKPEKKEPEAFKPPKIDPSVEPLVEWIRDKKGPPLLFELSRASDFLHLKDALKETPELPVKLLYLSRSSYSDYNHVVEEIGKLEATVMLSAAVGRLPHTATRYNLPAESSLAGGKVVLLPRSDAQPAFDELRVNMAELVRCGLSREEALKSVTLNAAEALGVEKQLGSIEEGKAADLIFLDGDPLAPGTRVTRVMIGGKIAWEAGK